MLLRNARKRELGIRNGEKTISNFLIFPVRVITRMSDAKTVRSRSRYFKIHMQSARRERIADFFRPFHHPNPRTTHKLLKHQRLRRLRRKQPIGIHMNKLAGTPFKTANKTKMRGQLK